MSVDIDVYTMELHETRSHKGYSYTRVPGGWYYSEWDYDQSHWQPGVFIPFNNEFQGRKS